MKKLLVFAILVLSILAFSQITVLGPWAGAEQDKFMPVLNAFTQKTGIEVTYQTFRAEDLANVLPAQFATKKTPGDLIFMWPSFITANTDHVMDMTGVMKEDMYISGALNNLMMDNKVYGFAYTAKVKPGFWYRKSFFEENGLKPPKTWEELELLLKVIETIPGIKKAIASGDGVGWPLSDITEHFLITFGGPELQKDLIDGNIMWKSHIVRGSMEKLAYLIEMGYFSEPSEWTTILKQWWNGDYGLYFMGSWITGMVDDPEDLSVFSLPGTKGMVFGIDYAFVPKYSDNMDEAVELAKYLASAEGQSVQVSQGGHIATAIGVAEMNYPPVDMEVAKLIIGVESLNDLDDSIGGGWQPAFWDQLKLLWVKPDRLDQVLNVLDEKMME